MSLFFKKDKSAEKRKSFFSFKQAIAIFLMVFLLGTSFNFKNANAQMVVADPGSIAATIGQTAKDAVQWVKDTWLKVKDTVLIKAGSKAFNVTLRRALNKVAYDYATALGSGDWGQQPLFQAKEWGAYFTDVADQAAGGFIEDFANFYSQENSDKMKELGKQESAAYDQQAECMASCASLEGYYVNKDPSCVGTMCERTAITADEAQTACQAQCQQNYQAAMKPITEQKKSLSSRPIATCQPSSIDVKLRIALGLAQVNSPSPPNCTATEMVSNWKSAADRYTDFKNPDYLSNTLPQIFNPVSNDLGIYLTLKTDLLSKQKERELNERLQAEIGQGYTDKRNIAGNLISIPNKSRMDTEAAGQMYVDNFGQYTGDALVDAANIFINQAALTAFNKLMSSLGDKVKKGDSSNPTNIPGGASSGAISSCNPLTDPSCAPASYGQGNVAEAAAKLIKPIFTTQADYNILSNLVTCVDPENPGPTECVIDDRFMQAITEKRTVAEALTDGFLQKSWLLSTDSKSGNSYNARNISILRKYRILPVGWEEAINKIEQLNKRATLMDLVSCFDPSDSYAEFGNEFDVRDQSWCQGLVDPNWVLKAPLNYCRKQGFGGQILSMQIIAGQESQGDVPALPSSLDVGRVDNYCADEQTCIKEKADGSCEAYGYCVSEKRTWSFAADGCEPIYNTCQTFSKDTGASVSYLKNTLDYGSCNADNAGCQAYSWFGAYSASDDKVSWDRNYQVYLNDNAGSCGENEEGCSGLLRVKPSWGSNLIMNAGFENDQVNQQAIVDNPSKWQTMGVSLNDWYFKANSNSVNNAVEIADASYLSNSSGIIKALHLEGNNQIGLYSTSNNSLLPDNFSFLSGQAYTLSADVYIVSAGKVSLWMGNITSVPTDVVSATTEANSWQHLSFTKTATDTINDPSFAIVGQKDSNSKIDFYIKNIKFELSDYDTGFKLYGAYKIYEKVLPPYLEATCYINSGSGVKDYRLKPGAPSVCYDFARKCNKDEAGCELYSSLDNFSIPAQAAPSDYCPGECLGYDTYVSKTTYFNSPAAENMIPDTAVKCSAASVGCNEFTNLDELAQGGERKEYYSFLKQCIKPDTSACADFYMWNNGQESGYQLSALSLKIDPNSTGDPFVVADDSSECSAEIFNALPGDPDYNPDCRQFYNKSGSVSYHLLSRTVSCSDNCKTFRMTAKNIDSSILSANDCLGPNKKWDVANNVCYSCLNGGVWYDNQQACLYKAIPEEGLKCAAKDNGCKEFNGNRGNSLRLVRSFDFGDGTLNPWTWEGNIASISTDSINRDGYSMKVEPSFGDDDTISLNVGNSVSAQASYVIKFLAKAQNAVNLLIYFENNNDDASIFGATDSSSLTISGSNEWQTYQVNLNILDHAVDVNEALRIKANGLVKLDNIVLQEISDKYYLLSNSARTPDICYYDMLDNFQGADYNLGCSAYSDRDGVYHNLHRFSSLCQDSAVGCEMMINTHNYGPYNSRAFNDSNDNGLCDSSEEDCTLVPQDSVIYAVFDRSKQCNGADQGCSRLGLTQKQGNNWYFSDVYKLNNPDNYDKSLCQESAVGCARWRDDDGSYNYFKDPGFNTCVYRNPLGGGQKAWFFAPVMRCDANSDGKISGSEGTGSICASDSDCGSSAKCIVDNNDYECPVSYLKTIGYGGMNNRIPTPDGSAGLCETSASTCTEYIDPISRFSNNLIINPRFEDLNSDEAIGDGWSSVSGCDNALSYQNVVIKAGRLYKFYFSDPSNEVSINFSCNDSFRILETNNKFSDPVENKQVQVLANNPILFLSPINTTCKIVGGKTGRNFELKEAIVSYQKESEVDKNSCNGIVDFDNGCILFNERSQSGSEPINLNGAWNASLSQDKNSPALCGNITINNVIGEAQGACLGSQNITFNTCNANQIIKVRPDRVCGSWLDCTSYSIDPISNEKTCYSLGECDRLNDRQECASFVNTSDAVHNFNQGSDKNSSGYSLLNAYHFPNMKEVGIDLGWRADFESRATALSCVKSVGSGACVFDKNINTDSIVIEPAGAPTDYPAHGKGFLKVLSYYQIAPMAGNSCIPIVRDQDYYLNFLVNTKNSGVNAKVTVTKCDGTPLSSPLSESFSAPNGWERKIMNIKAGDNSIRILLGSDSTEVHENYVYFDDLNIEPVLQVNNSGDVSKDYVAKECRLYPQGDSLTCVSSGENVISDGLYGYCLEHDRNNKNVCLLWYPVDNISAGASRNNKISGYSGAFPLNFCSEMNGNFNLLENRKTTLMNCSEENMNNNWIKCYINSNNSAAGNRKYIISGTDGAAEVGDFGWHCNVGDTGNKSVEIYDNLNTSTVCGSDDYWVFKQGIGGKVATFCVPTFFTGWPSSSSRTEANKIAVVSEHVPFYTCGGETSLPASEGWFVYNGMNVKTPLDESKNHDPAIAVWELNSSRDVRDLKFAPLQDHEDNYDLICNRFTQVVNQEGYNMAWANRLSKNSAFPTSTPTFFPSTYDLAGYGRNREAIPFGAAVVPHDFDIYGSTPIKFRDQFSQSNREEIFAGRPYGCSGDGCNNIGYCSGDPNVFCLYRTGDTYLNSRSCYSGKYGTCLDLWGTYPGPITNPLDDPGYQQILKTLFLKNYASYNLLGDNYIFDNQMFNESGLVNCSGNERTNNAFCAVYPEIKNVTFNGSSLSNGSVNIVSAGIYSLAFTTNIDIEQRPLREIYIDWGDGNIQIISNQDSRSNPDQPHVAYHYYSTTGSKTIRITVFDNWDKYGSFGNPIRESISAPAGGNDDD